MQEAHYMEELGNVISNEPLFAGDTISHESLRVLTERGWVARLAASGDIVSTKLGRLTFSEWIDAAEDHD